MDKFNGTPGLWEFKEIDDDGISEFTSTMVVSQDGSVIACVGPTDGTELQCDLLNANLIAAAPELLDALQDALHAYDKHSEHSEWDFARTAIAKALGK